MRISFIAEYFECVHYKRKENSMIDYEKLGTTFRAKVISDYDKRSFQAIAGLVTDNVTLTLYTTNLNEDVKVGDKILFNGAEYQVDFVQVAFNNISYTMGANRFNPKFMARKLPKIIGVK